MRTRKDAAKEAATTRRRAPMALFILRDKPRYALLL